jgi:nucleotide-binding universal stress UspA family protein
MSPNDSVLRILVAYDGRDAARRAAELQSRLGTHFHGGLAIDYVAWCFSLLTHRQLSREAARQAEAADMIVIAANGEFGLPADVRNWIKHWVPRKLGMRAAFVLLLAGDESPGKAGLIASLKTRVSAVGMDFFYNYEDQTTCAEMLDQVFQPAGNLGSGGSSSRPDSRHQTAILERHQRREIRV